MKEIFLASLVMIMGLLSCYLGWHTYSENSILNNSNLQVISEPMTDYTEEQKNGRVIGYSISPTFSPEGSSRTYKCHGSVPKSTIDKLQDDPVITITYAAHDPSLCRIEGEEEESGWFMIILGLILVIGSGAYIYNAYSALKD